MCNVVVPQGASSPSSTAKPPYRSEDGSGTRAAPFRASFQASTITAWRCSTWLRREIPTLGSRAACGLSGTLPPRSRRSPAPLLTARRRPHPSWRSPPPPPRRPAGESSRRRRESPSRWDPLWLVLPWISSSRGRLWKSSPIIQTLHRKHLTYEDIEGFSALSTVTLEPWRKTTFFVCVCECICVWEWVWMISTFRFFVIFICPSEDLQHPFQHTFSHVGEICLISNELVIRVKSTFSPSAANGVKYLLKVAVLFFLFMLFCFHLETEIPHLATRGRHSVCSITAETKRFSCLLASCDHFFDYSWSGLTCTLPQLFCGTIRKRY